MLDLILDLAIAVLDALVSVALMPARARDALTRIRHDRLSARVPAPGAQYQATRTRGG